MAAKRKKAGRPAGAARKTVFAKPAAPQHGQPGSHLYTLRVSIIGGMVTEKFAKKNPVLSRTIQIRGDQTLEDLHDAIFDAFDRFDAHMYEFRFGERPMDPNGPRYVLGRVYEGELDDGGNRPAGRVDEAQIDALGLTVDQAFGYWFDFGDDWWHQIDVMGIEEAPARGKYPKVTERVGQSPPQYMEEQEEEE